MDKYLGRRSIKVGVACPWCKVVAMDKTGNGCSQDAAGAPLWFEVYFCKMCAAKLEPTYTDLSATNNVVTVKAMLTPGNKAMNRTPVEVRVIWHLQGTELVSITPNKESK